MDEIRQPATIANGGIVFLSASDMDEKAGANQPGYIYYYYLNNCQLSEETSSARLVHYETKSSIVSSRYQSSGGDSSVCIGSRYDTMDNAVVVSGKVFVSSGCVANNTTIASGGSLIISTGATASATTVNGKALYVSGGLVRETTINSGSFIVDSGGTANETTVNSGVLVVSNGATANSVTIVHGSMSIYGGGKADSITVNSGCPLSIYSGGTATNVVENGGYVNVTNGAEAAFVSNTISGLALSSASATVHSKTTANGISIYTSGSLQVYYGGTANRTTVNGGGLIVFSGGTANSTTVNGGNLTLSSGGTANSTTVNSGGHVLIYNSGAVANSTTINSGGSLIVYTDARATSTTVNDGTLKISQGGQATLCSASPFASITNYGSLDFLVSSASPAGEFLFGDYYKYSDSNTTSQYAITICGSLQSSEYRLLSNTASFKHTVTVKNENSAILGTFVWDEVSSSYNKLNLNGHEYTLKKVKKSSTQNDLVLADGATDGVEVYDDDELTSSARAMQSVVLDADGDNRMLIKSGGTATDTTAGEKTRIVVSSGGVFNGGTMVGCSMGLEGKLSGQLTLDGGLSVSETASAENAEIVLQVHPDSSMIGIAGIDGLDYLSGINLTVEVDPNLTYGTYHLATGAADFDQTITVKKDEKEYTYVWDPEKNVYKLNGEANFISLVKTGDDNDELDLIYQSYTIVNFEKLKAAVSADWQQFKVQVKLKDFKDGWGKQTNHRPYYSVSVTDLAFSAEGTDNHIDITCNGRFEGTIGILNVVADLSENVNVGETKEKAGLYLSVDKNEQTGKWDWGDWDLVGKFTITLRRVDRRYKFHFFESVYDPKTLKGIADINTKTGCYTITIDWETSGWKKFDHMVASATLKECHYDDPNSQEEKGLEISSITFDVFDNPKNRVDAGLHIYKIHGTAKNLASCDTAPAEFHGEIGFTWRAMTFTIKKKWQKEMLSAVGLKNYANGTLTVSAIDTELEVTMNVEGDFSAGGEVRFLSARLADRDSYGNEINVQNFSIAHISGKVSYFASNKSLIVTGNLGIAGIVEMNGFVWSINNTLIASATGTYNIPGWMEFLSGYSSLNGHLELISTSQATCIAVWGDATNSKGKTSYLGYRYNLTNGDSNKISKEKDVTAVYQNFADQLAKETTGTKRFERITAGEYQTLQKLIFHGSYSNASDKMQVCFRNETTGEIIECALTNYSETPSKGGSSVLRSAAGDNAGVRWVEESVADAIQDGTGGSRGGSNTSATSLQVIVDSFSETGFTIRLVGDLDLLTGDWSVDIRDDGADLAELDISLQCEESSCQLDNYSITGIDSQSITIDYSVSGGDDDVIVSMYCTKYDGEGPQTVCVGTFESSEAHAAIDTSIVADCGFYEFYLHAAGNFIPFDSETNAVFSIAGRTASDDAIVEDAAALDAAEYWMIVSSAQDFGTYTLAKSAEGFHKAITLMTDTGSTIGTISVGETKVLDDTKYTLALKGDTLSVEVVSSVVPNRTFFTGDFNGDHFDTLAVQSGNSITVYMNGEPWGLGVTLEDGWNISGVGDFSGDGLDDFLRVNGEGFVVGEMSNGNGTFSPQVLNFKGAGWEILGTGDFNGNGADDVLIANPTAASETVGLLGYWESGVTWTLINGYSAEWECIATGDFNADGKCDMLWRNSFIGANNEIYNAYCTWIVDDPIDWRMVSVANPDEWDFLCSGDFNGDRMNDIAMINAAGVVGIWGVNDGWLNSWTILSAVTPEWQLAGVGDFNADGTDDIAWCNSETGLVGAWQIENKELASWQTLTTLS